MESDANYAIWPAGGKVLNALRHRRWNQSLTGWTIGALKCAQRLAASKMESVRHNRRQGLQKERAQRLAASKMESGQARPRLQQKIIVLNALRHRRWNQLSVGRVVSQPEECSTPCGIEDGIRAPMTARAGRWVKCAQRLAASKMESVL